MRTGPERGAIEVASSSPGRRPAGAVGHDGPVPRSGGPDVRGLDDLALAHALADAASALALGHFHRGVAAEPKADGSLVTVADREVEGMLRAALAEARPLDAVLGEEMGRTGSSPRTWVLDPIDGTESFVRREPDWRVQIALQDGPDIVLALVDEPVNRRRWWATAGGGTWERAGEGAGARRLRVSGPGRGDPVVACHPAEVADRLPRHRPADPRSALPLVEVVRGEIDAFFVDCCQVWDHAPWVLLVCEAGGRFTDHEGGTRADRRGGLYSNAHVHDRLLAGIRRP